MYCKRGALRKFSKFTRKHLCQRALGLRPATLLKKTLWLRCFLVNFVKFLKTLFFIEHRWWPLLFRATQNFVHNIYLYTTGTIFCKYVFLFCATLNIFSQHESSFGCHIIFLLPQHFFVTHIILVRNANFYSKYFLLTKQFFVEQNIFLCCLI